ncbi:MAG: DTW domain-containing protein [Gammaproteobacteria bacterium]|nr:DTW domain-containing protein [Gammaproteobacteria bacterium]
MNKRARCPQCLRPPVACLCHTVTPIDNRTEIVILQHPSEVKHAKGTAKIAELSLRRCQVIVGENFNQNVEFQALFNEPSRQVMLLYPQDNAISPEDVNTQVLNNLTIIVLDGSWKKAYKMYCLNPVLQQLPCIGIDVTNQSNYRIRKSSRSDSLSTVEACFELLTQLEGKQRSFEPLLKSFDAMVQFQIDSMPDHVKSRYS